MLAARKILGRKKGASNARSGGFKRRELVDKDQRRFEAAEKARKRNDLKAMRPSMLADLQKAGYVRMGSKRNSFIPANGEKFGPRLVINTSRNSLVTWNSFAKRTNAADSLMRKYPGRSYW